MKINYFGEEHNIDVDSAIKGLDLLGKTMELQASHLRKEFENGIKNEIEKAQVPDYHKSKPGLFVDNAFTKYEPVKLMMVELNTLVFFLTIILFFAILYKKF